MKRTTFLLAVTALLLLAGTLFAREEMVTSPKFTAWSKCTPGTSIAYGIDVEANGESVKKLGVVMTLKSKDAEKVVVNVLIDEPGQKGQDTEIPAKIEAKRIYLAAGDPKDATVENVKEGTDKIEVLGKMTDVTKIEFDLKDPNGPTKHTTEWISTDFPHAVVQSVSEWDVKAGDKTIHIKQTQTLSKVTLVK